MTKLMRCTSLVTTCWLLLFVPSVPAATHIIEAGQTHTLKEDLVLKGDDALEIRGAADKRCTLIGNQHQIRSADKWTGAIKITHCTIQKLGAAAKTSTEAHRLGAEFHAFDLKVAGKGSVTIEQCTLDESSSIQIQNDENSVTTFRNNTFLDNSTVAIDKDIGKSAHCFVARGNSKERKLFQGNSVARGKVV